MRMRKTRIIVLIVILTICTSYLRASAGDVTIDFTAVVTSIGDSYCQCITDDEVAIGDTLYGYYIFDEDAADSDTSSTRGFYEMVTPPYEIFMTNHKVEFYSKSSDPDIRFTIYDNGGSPLSDEYLLYSYSNGPDPVYAGNLSVIILALQDFTMTVLDTDTLPRFPPPLEEWEYRSVWIYGSIWDVGAELVSMSLRTVTSVTPGYEDPALFNIYPNPFNRSTTLEFTITDQSPVRVIVYNVAGQAVSSLELDDVRHGINRVAWHPNSERGTPLPTGIYFVALEVSGKTLSRKVLLLR